ncbi:MAG TPA: beta/gamma crystallin-related protein, partial [Sideroxyarcus sp.]|nr:beta/gamma crystallin-related protein [Sideroxyarcus sp.]
MKRSHAFSMLAVASFAAASALARAAEVTVFKQPEFTGDKLTLRRDTNNLSGAGFQDQISSVVVHSGRWQFCSQPDFNGDCVTLGPGEYPQLARSMNHRIESAREV